MSDYGEKKIRDTLKAVFDSFESVESLIFTTYNYDPDFFEEHIIAFLMGSDKKISTIGELNATNQWIKDHGVAVYYDYSALQAGSGCITLPVYPQQVVTGVFHPKVVIVFGKLPNKDENAVYLIVSSSNLTVTGYGRNQEAFSCIRVKDKRNADSLRSFIEAISENDRDRHKDIKNYLKNGIFSRSSNIEFIWNYGSIGDNLIDRLSELPPGNMKIVSPYFDEEGPDSLLDSIDGRKKTLIIPAIEGETYNIHYSVYERLKKEKVEFACLGIGNGEKRFVHAKIITKGNYSLVGSYNFTTAALKQKNAEAALLIQTDRGVEIPLCEIEENRFLSDDEIIENRDEAKTGLNRPFVTVTVDWAANEMKIETRFPDDNDDYYLFIDGMKGDSGWRVYDTDKNGPIRIILNDKITRILLRHKQFSIYKNDTLYLKGLINEINWMGIRPEIGCESLDETIAEWFSYSGKNKGEHVHDLRCLTEDEEETEKIIGGGMEPEIDIFDNYYLASKALNNMQNEIWTCSHIAQNKCPETRKTKRYTKRKIKNAEETLYRILVTAPGSITQMLNYLIKREQDQKEETDVVYPWLICKYLLKALELMPKELSNFNLFVDKKKQVSRELRKIEKRYHGIILKDSSEEYIKWIEKELFIKRKPNV